MQERRERIDALMGTANGGLFPGSYTGGVFRPIDNGGNWIRVSDRLIARFVLSFMTSSSGHIFAGTYFGGGVFRSTDNGGLWAPVNTGLDCGNIWSLAINPVGTIFAGAAGSERSVSLH